MVNRGGHRNGGVPLERINSVVKRHRLKAETLRRFNDGHFNAAKIVNRDASLVAFLCLSVRPSTVFGAIGAVIVDTVKRATKRPCPHVINKVLKAAEPSVADGNAAPSIFGIVWPVRLQTAPLHINPRSHFRRAIKAVLSIGNLRPRNQVGASAATAAFRFTVSQIGRSNTPLDTADTSSKRVFAAVFEQRPIAKYFNSFHSDTVSWKGV